MTKIAIVGYGNIGKAALRAAEEARDIRVAGIVRRAGSGTLDGYPVVTDIGELGQVDAALLCVPSRNVPDAAEEYLLKGISTVDSFDMHGEIPKVHARLGAAAKKGGAVCMLAAGWDPGSDSVLRALFQPCEPVGLTHTNFGPGISMGHSVAARKIPGVADAISMTIPLGESLHRRMVYVQLENGARLSDVEAALKADAYFAHDETHVIPVEDTSALYNTAHGVSLTRGGVASGTPNQRFAFNMTIDGPSLTAQVMLGCARAAAKREAGCYTMIELPLIDLLPGKREDWIARLV